ncbi:MAG: MFS transporter [Butyrivibrio sp.]|nr:MFS transporter [Butyrivibrio sp.]
MYNIFKKHRRWKLICAILSLSLLTVMAGAAVAPALSLIQEYFAETDRSLVQMIVSMPALFIAGTNLFLFKPLCKRFRARTLLIFGLLLYTVFGCLAGLFSNILMILVCRALVGVGVGIIMPLSTGLLSFYFTRDKQGPLMGYSSALNMLGGVVATLIAGGLAMISWRLSFMVYLLGLISIVLCVIWMPNDKIYDNSRKATSAGSIRQYVPYILVMFVLSFTFFVYPASFALECSSSGAIPQNLIAPVMAMMDVFGFAGGLIFSKISKSIKKGARLIAPVLFIISYVFLGLAGGASGTLIGSAFVGLANGIGMPFLMTSASAKAGRNAATTVMPLISASLYLAQFATPLILSAAGHFADVSSFFIALFASLLLAAISFTIKEQ